ncbi:MAG: synthetase [Planctomycetota bacterium]|jgi:NAD+ synthetase
MRIVVGHADLRLGDLEAALAAIASQAAAAAAAGADLLLLPELAAFGGYPPRDLLDRPWLVERQWAGLRAASAAWPLPVAVGAVEPLPGPGPALANVLAVFDGGRLLGLHRKCRLPANDVFDEPRHFRPGDGGTVVEVRGRRVGLTVCEDIWPPETTGRAYPVDPLADLAARCEIVLNASASPYHLGKGEARRAVVAAAARRVGVPVVWCNLLGAHDELLFDGGAIRAEPDGRIGESPRWTDGVGVPDRAPVDPAAEPDLWTALVTGIRGYCRRTRQERVVLGLSGGIDSALVAALAVDALGADRVTGILMPGPYSSRGSVVDALDLAERLGIRTHQCMITRAWEVLLGELDPLCPQGPADLMAQNLQSRLRGALVMAAANQLGAMALTTGNKSELACGYCTIYGDMNGGLAPIGDLYKTAVYRLSRWANRDGERIPAATIEKPPSAELRPDQTDQDSLPPYDQLDRILDAFIDAGEDPAAIARREDPAVVAQVIRLVEISEFKRRQAAPVLRVSRKAFGMGRRMPVARAF